MSAAMVAIPPLDKMFLIGIWVETVLYGMNILVYATAVFVLVRRLDGATDLSSRMLLAVSTLAFALSTAYIAVTVRQLLEAFIYSPPGTASLYFANESARLPQAKLDLILIWRLWVLYGQKNYVIIVPLILEALRLGSSITAMVRGGEPGVPIFDPLIHNMGLVDWITDLVLNVGVTCCIAGRLWWMGRKVAGVTVSGNGSGGSENRYTRIIFTIIESGSLFAVATLVTVSLYLRGNVATVVAIDSITQLATITPLLILVRVGLGLTHGVRRGGSAGGVATTALGTNHGVTSAGSGMTFARAMTINVSKVHESDSMGDVYPLSSLHGHSQDMKYAPEP
ncbi:hypothetical protein EUX98_g7751 [Antrodiella citrinella]|uniref:Uncharacterized protein n=1 Tax=Antrodiella citrinella TaxID=2447956 RepID=A0A4S4MMF2_9APHY|nr:hypothetical protein EUX98_g7751 [Antrodiella citrinella]